jgi:hypothetical protein
LKQDQARLQDLLTALHECLDMHHRMVQQHQLHGVCPTELLTTLPSPLPAQQQLRRAANPGLGVSTLPLLKSFVASLPTARRMDQRSVQVEQMILNHLASTRNVAANNNNVQHALSATFTPSPAVLLSRLAVLSSSTISDLD